MRRGVENIMIAVVIGIAGYVTSTSWTAMQEGWASETWPTTIGTVTKTEITKSSGYRTGTSYYPTVTYQYGVQGSSYESSRMLAFRRSFGRANANKRLDAYPVGSQQTVYYNPNDPSQAVLITGVTWQNHVSLYACAAVAVIATIGLIVRLREHLKPHEDLRKYGAPKHARAGQTPPRPPRA